MATKPTASKTSAPRKRAPRKSAKTAANIVVPIKELLTALLKSYDIKEGHWVIDVQMGTGKIAATKPERTEVYPATLVVFEGVTLVRVAPDDKILESGNTVNASNI
ncbi:hypothetical protein [Allopusillimonas ginsengisoli]|uniref:hypothetical protein n=1 Tax=Allopusillimonas ginsengisoli TaxID=453575 RepID=UPI0010225A49|nr:hypothetical protein [Allopusillimonas ginsengisoli]TEA78668.1 hypothetical protein ERE07_09745 [Allopusillimonas ginsengisoli]